VAKLDAMVKDLNEHTPETDGVRERVGIPEPFNKVATVILVVAAVVIVISLLTGAMQPFPIIGRLM